MTPEKRHLMADLLDESEAARRDGTLRAGGRILRRKRWRRLAVLGFAVIAIVGIAAFSLLKPDKPRPEIVASAPTADQVAKGYLQPKALTDDELLALFPNTPVALASLDNGKKRLIFPRPGDEKRFVTRM